MTSENWVARCRQLQNDIWEKFRATSFPYIDFYVESRRLTAEEWEEVKSIISTNKPICTLYNANWGFGIGMSLLLEPVPTYPGAEQKPDFLMSITKDHLPIPRRGPN